MENLMIKHILAGARGLASDADLLAAAFNLARPFSAHVDVLHVQRDPARDLPIYGEGFPADMLDTIVREAERHAREASAAARRMFDEAVAASAIPVSGVAKGQGVGEDRVTAGWREITGLPARVFAAEARFADLTLLSRPTGGPSADLDILGGALFETGRPVLLTGNDMARLDKVVIAWDGSPAAVRAVACAHDFITRAATVTIVVVEDEAVGAMAAAVARRPHPRPDRLVEHLAWHDVIAEVQLIEREGRTVGETLAAAAMNLNAGLLVMGGYGHSRLREIVLGGATRHMLANPTGCPVLLAH
jgi:nucleotide-binding universal stress UspA family protein